MSYVCEVKKHTNLVTYGQIKISATWRNLKDKKKRIIRRVAIKWENIRSPTIKSTKCGYRYVFKGGVDDYTILIYFNV